MYMHINTPLIWKARVRWLGRLLDFWPKITLLRRVPWLGNLIYELYIGERLVEYSFSMMHVPVERGKLLFVGCYGEKTPIELASLGYQVWGVDVIQFPLRHPNFTFVRGDICKMPFTDNFFNAVIAVSTIEHIGLGRYGDPSHSDGDREAIQEIHRVLAPDGRLILTVPFGEKCTFFDKGVPLHRVYNLEALKNLLKGFKITNFETCVKKDDNWVPAPHEIAEKVIEKTREVLAVALVVAEKG